MAKNRLSESFEMRTVQAAPSIQPTPTQRLTQQSWAKRIFRRRLLSWTTLFLAGTSYVLLVVYLWHSDLVCRHTIFGHSQASALGTANVLSWVANPLLGASIGQSLDLTSAMLIAREGGHYLLDNLPLQAGTGIDGLFQIICNSRRLNRYHPTAWSIFRLLSMVIVPVIGIIVLSNAAPSPIYFQQTTQNVARGYGIGTFNASLAELLQPMADAFFGTRFKDFLSDQDLVANLSNETDLAGCSSGLVNDPRGACRAKYFVPGGIEQFAPRLLTGDAFTTGGDLQPVLARNLNGYYLQFEASNATHFEQQTECVKYGYPLVSYQLCLKDVAPQQMAAFLRPCPKSLAANLQCMSNATWPSDEGWGTILEVNTRHADVTYNGLNGTILDYHFLSDDPSPVNITASDLLGVFNVLFNTSNSTSAFGKSLSALGLASNKPVEPFIIWQYFQGLVELAKNDTRANTRAQMGLQSLLAIPIYHCQAKDFAEMRRLLLEQIDNTTAIIQTLGLDLVNQFPIIETDTNIFPAVVRYKLDVGQGYLFAYIILSGSTLLLCLIASSFGSCTDVGRKFRHMGPFPLLTDVCDCKIVDANGNEVPWERFRSFTEDGRLEMVKGMHMKMVLKRDVTPPKDRTSGASSTSTIPCNNNSKHEEGGVKAKVEDLEIDLEAGVVRSQTA